MIQKQIINQDAAIQDTLNTLEQTVSFIQNEFNQDKYIHPIAEVKAVNSNRDNIKILEQAYQKVKLLVITFTKYLDFKRTLINQLYDILERIAVQNNNSFSYNSNNNYVLLMKSKNEDYIITLVRILQKFIEFNQLITILQPSNDISNFKRYDKMLKDKSDIEVVTTQYPPLIEYLMTNVESSYETLGCYPTFEKIWQEPQWNEQIFQLMIELSNMLAMKYNLYNESQTMLCIASAYVSKCKHKSILDKSIVGLKLSELLKFLKKHNYIDMLQYFLLNEQLPLNQIRQDEYKLLK